MKLFLGINLPEDAIQKVYEQTDPIRRDYPDFNWVPTDNLHVTLYHIGEVADTKIPLVVEYVENSIYDVEKTHLFARATDLFINTKQIILYMSFLRNKVIEDVHERMLTLFEDKSTKKYIPHLTMARYKIPSKQQYFHLKKKLHDLDVELDFSVTQIHLYQSIDRARNPLYNIIKSFPLQDKL
jgi:2'-5' RNA ligase